jgi:hypothetical protein
MRLLVIFIVSAIIIFGTIALMIFYNQLKRCINIQIYKIKQKINFIKKQIDYNKIIIKSINNNISNSILIESILNQFVYFYENLYNDNEPWEFPEDFFENGKVQLTELYRWIKKTRIENYKEINGLNFNFNNNNFIYWGKTFEGLNYKIVNDEIKIIPIEFVKTSSIKEPNSHNNINFNLKILKIKNDLFKIDSEKCKWILERRHFFGI